MKNPLKRITTMLLLLAMTLSGCGNPGNVKGKTTTEGMFDWKNATIYYAMTDRFFNGDESNDESYGRLKTDVKGKNAGTFNGGDFKGLTEKLKEGYFTDNGINGIWISAPYEQIHGFVGGGKDGDFAHYGFHGYYPLDWTMTDANFGTAEEFGTFVKTAHEKGIRVVLDVVMNHTGYNTVKDMAEFGFGKLNGIDGNWQPSQDQRYDAYHEFIDYGDEAAWSRWWGSQWVRAGLPGYDRGGNDDRTMSLSGLPDIKTESTEKVDVPPVLKTKWEKTSEEDFRKYSFPAMKNLRQNLDTNPAGYITMWLSAWVKEYGIDGFRIDTAKHVEPEKWKALKESADTALKSWRKDHSDDAASKWSDDFFMAGEAWGHGAEKSDYFDNGFDAMINFRFQGDGSNGPVYKWDTMPGIFNNYSDKIQNENINFLSYISSHDTYLFNRKGEKDALTYLLLLPGAVEIFYGDETGRPYSTGVSDPVMGTRSFMNWGKEDKEISEHFKKLAGFRNRNLAVGAGAHTDLSKDPYSFKRVLVKGGVINKVMVLLKYGGTGKLRVSDVFENDDIIRDAYTMKTYKVKNGSIDLQPDPSGIVLLEEFAGENQ